MNTDQIMASCDQVRETAYAIHHCHGNGYLEKVYENALARRLHKAGLDVKQQHQLIIRDEDGTEIGEYYAQLMHYLKGSRKEHGLLINFSSYKFQIKKFAKTGQTSATFNTFNQLSSLVFAFLVLFRG